MATVKATKGGNKIVSQQALYSTIAAKADVILDVLFKSLESRQPAIAMGAAKVLLNKIIPDLKSVEVGGGLDANGQRQPIQLYINSGRGFIPAVIGLSSSSDRGATAIATEIQDADLAPESPQDDNSDNGDHKTEPA